ncbi:hypothetical protein FRB95_003075 [Tulasnella sp. JGI-2019a]|nr:hypothetical protein FRB95_003075 [Tulasnella sp. JGI-2019a]
MISGHTHPILFVDELIVEFLQYLHRPESDIDDADINAAGLTCKAWRDPSLTVKWREAHLKSLFSVLAPLSEPNSVFARVPTDSDHCHFHDIARRVHSLKDCGDMALGESVFRTIFNGLPESAVLLPNLHSVRIIARSRTSPICVADAARFLPLFPSSLSRLALSIDPASSESRIPLL